MTVFDIDGVLADVRHRLHFLQHRPKDWDGFFGAAPADPVLTEGARAAAEAAESTTIVYLTGRPSRCRADTQQWLRDNGLPEGRLYMRPDRDRRPARFYKAETLRRIAADDEVVAIIDDDRAVVDHLRAAGWSVLHATWMHESVQQLDLLEQAQESEGRT